MMRAKQGKLLPLKVLVTVLAVIVAVIFVSAAYQIGEHARGYASDYDARAYIYAAEGERFGDLYETAVRDMGKDAKHDAQVAECRALAFYCEQAVLEHAYRATGDAEKADAFAKRMGEYEAQLGSMAPKAKAVRELVAG